ncbi:MAG: peptidylprolyl isomerase [Nocardioides sp.]
MKRLLVLPATLALIVSLAACSDDEPADTAVDEPAASETSDTGDTGITCSYTESGEAARPVELPPTTAPYDEKVEVTITTSAGDLGATLNGDTTPCTVGSFVSLAEQGFYDETPCPRITTDPGFQLLQCGDPTGTTGGGPGYAFPDELTGAETYPAGTLAMANSGPNTNGSQFFIVYGDTGLAPDYTVFGTVNAEDLSVIEEVAAGGDDGSNPAGGGAPNTPIDIVSVTVD